MSQMQTSYLLLGDARGLIEAARSGSNAVRTLVDSVTGADRQFKSAAASASVFEQAILEDKRAFDQLRAAIDPVFAAEQRLASQQEVLNRAMRSGAITTNDYQRTLGLLKRGEQDLLNSHRALGTGAANNSYIYKNLAYQVNQVGQMGAVTGQWMTAVSVQLPDILASFGSLPLVLLGGAAAVAASLVPALLRGTDAAAELDDKLSVLADTMDRLRGVNTSAAQSLIELSQTYGENAAAAAQILEIQQQIATVQAQRAFASTVGGIADIFGAEESSDVLAGQLAAYDALILRAEDLSDQLATSTGPEVMRLNAELARVSEYIRPYDGMIGALTDLQERFAVTADEARELALAASDIGSAQGIDAQADAANRLALLIFDATDGLKAADEETADLYYSLLDAVTAGLELSALDIAGPLGAAANEAGRLAGNLMQAIGYQSSLQYGKLINEYGSGPDAARASVMDLNAPEPPRIIGVGNPFAPRASSGRSGRGAGGGASSALRDAERERQRVIDDIAKQMDDLAPSYERDVAALQDWRKDALEQLDPTKAGYERFATDVEFIFQERLAEAYREDLERRDDWAAGVTRGLMDVADDMKTWADLGQDLATEWSSGLEDAFVSANRTGKFEIGDLVDYTLEQFARLAFQQAVQPAVTGVFDWAAGAIGGIFGAQSHTGSEVGSGSVRQSVGSLSARERLTVTTVGQRVFTPRQIENGSAVVEALALAASRPAGAQVGVGITVNNYAGADVRTEERPDGTISIDIMAQMERKLAAGIRSGQGPVGGAIQDRFGLRPNYRGGTR